MEINREVAKRVLDVVDAGLSSGLGEATPGQMCVEAAVCYALGLPHNDDPKCVSYALRRLKIALNDANWPSNEARAKGMRKLAILQLGTLNVLDDVAFSKRVSGFTIRGVVPRALRIAASVHPDQHHRDELEKHAVNCEKSPDAARAADAAARAAANAAGDAAADAAARAAANAAGDSAYAAYAAADAYAANAAGDSAYAAYAAADAADAAANAADSELVFFAEGIAQILIEMKVPAVEWLDLL